LHASAIRVDPDLYQHTDPTKVGNDMRMLVSDMAGRASIELKGRELGYDLAPRSDQDRELLTRVTERVKALEAAGYTFEAADASFELLLREEVDGARPAYFDVESWRAITESRPGGDAVSEATVKVVAGGRRLVAIGEGNGPVNALDQALRKALLPVYPELEKLELIDFRVRILDAAHGTDAVTRVLIETSDTGASWQTVGVGANVIEASWQALGDGLVYGLLRRGVPRR
jgi:2-isopropylmalate synthase